MSRAWFEAALFIFMFGASGGMDRVQGIHELVVVPKSLGAFVSSHTS